MKPLRMSAPERGIHDYVIGDEENRENVVNRGQQTVTDMTMIIECIYRRKQRRGVRLLKFCCCFQKGYVSYI
jgi:hypothetical protein